MREYAEDVTINEGTDAYGVTTDIRFQGRDMIVKKSFDAEPIIEQCKAERIATAGEKWGEMRKVGTIDAVSYGRIAAIKDTKERRQAIKDYFLAHQAFISFDRYLK